MRLFFAHALVLPVTVLTAVLCSARTLVRFRVVLEPAAGDVAITTGFWTRHVQLTRIERVEEVLRLGVMIKIGSMAYRFGPFRKRRRLERWLRIRTGFEGMELAVTRPAAAARSAGPVSPAAAGSRSAEGLPAACIVCGAGLFSLAVAALVEPQAGGWLVHSVALLLQAMYGGGGAVVVLIGAWMLRGAWRDRRTAPQPASGSPAAPPGTSAP
jgi:protein-S-isoprenylcysteine O-methyltransferase Ste14